MEQRLAVLWVLPGLPIHSLNFTTILHGFILPVFHPCLFPFLRLLFWFVIGLFTGHLTKYLTASRCLWAHCADQAPLFWGCLGHRWVLPSSAAPYLFKCICPHTEEPPSLFINLLPHQKKKHLSLLHCLTLSWEPHHEQSKALGWPQKKEMEPFLSPS